MNAATRNERRTTNSGAGTNLKVWGRVEAAVGSEIGGWSPIRRKKIFCHVPPLFGYLVVLVSAFVVVIVQLGQFLV